MYFFTLGSFLLLAICLSSVTGETPLLPLVQPPPQELGNSIKLSCGVDLAKINLSAIKGILWWKQRDDQKLPEKMKSIADKIDVLNVRNRKEFKDILTIKNIESSDVAVYRCIVYTNDKNHYYEHSVKLKLTSESEKEGEENGGKATGEVSLLPLLQPPLQRLGGSIKLSCGVDLTKIDASAIRSIFWWKRTGKKYEMIHPIAGKYNLLNVRNSRERKEILTINNIQSSDVGTYRCRVRTYNERHPHEQFVELKLESEIDKKEGENGQRVSAPVESPLVSLIQPKPLRKGDSIKWACGVNLTKIDASTILGLSWWRYRNGVSRAERVEAIEGKIELDPLESRCERKLVLTIKDIQSSDVGVYRCLVQTNNGHHYYDQSVELKLASEFPRDNAEKAIVRIPLFPQAQSVEKLEGSGVTLVCGVDTNRIQVSAIKDLFWSVKRGDGQYERIERNSGKFTLLVNEPNQKILLITDLQKSDTKDYRCSVQTDSARDGFNVALKIIPK